MGMFLVPFTPVYMYLHRYYLITIANEVHENYDPDYVDSVILGICTKQNKKALCW